MEICIALKNVCVVHWFVSNVGIEAREWHAGCQEATHYQKSRIVTMSIGIVLTILQILVVLVPIVSAFERKFKIHGNIVYSKHTDSVSWIWVVGIYTWFCSGGLGARTYSPENIGTLHKQASASIIVQRFYSDINYDGIHFVCSRIL